MTTYGGVSGNRLRQIIEQVEYLEEQKAALATDIREVFAEAKSAGFDVKAIRQILKIRKMDHDEHQEQEAILETYLQALKMIPAGGGADETSGEEARRAEGPNASSQDDDNQDSDAEATYGQRASVRAAV